MDILAIGRIELTYRRLQSCMGTRARLGYATLDVQLRKVYFVPSSVTDLSIKPFNQMLQAKSGQRLIKCGHIIH